jgi:hypothetical protein
VRASGARFRQIQRRQAAALHTGRAALAAVDWRGGDAIVFASRVAKKAAARLRCEQIDQLRPSISGGKTSAPGLLERAGDGFGGFGCYGRRAEQLGDEDAGEDEGSAG